MTIKYDIKTNNDNFIRLADTLRMMGVNNHNFHLQINDESLMGIDPWSPTLDMDTKMKIVVECSKNIWYYLREVVRIGGFGGCPTLRLKLNLQTLTTAYLYTERKNVISSSCRQQGRTVLLRVLKSYFIRFKTKTTINQINMNLKYPSNDGMIDQILVPSYLNLDMKRTEQAIKNSIVQSIANDIGVPVEYIKHATDSDILIIDDAAFNINGYTLLKQFEDNKNISDWTVISTTPCMPKDTTSLYLYELIKKSNNFDIEMFDSRNLTTEYIFVSYNPVELGMSREMFNEMAKMLTLSCSSANLDCELFGEWNSDKLHTYEDCMNHYDELAKK